MTKELIVSQTTLIKRFIDDWKRCKECVSIASHLKHYKDSNVLLPDGAKKVLDLSFKPIKGTYDTAKIVLDSAKAEKILSEVAQE